MQQIRFSDAIQRLASFGIKDQYIYLIDLVLLCEMAWADGKIQDAERDVLFGHLNCHVDSINRLAGCNVLSHKSAKEFVRTFLDNRPDQKLLKEIHDLIPAIRLSSKDPESVEKIRLDILNGCLDIAASAVTTYPYGLTERFTAEEKECYHKIVQLLS
ncbi:hypothetical protein [Desulfosediminicola flagellatus]|uniref:hypothetical protein n=1 Tax=Desulfosediminicola flagellatus TaxID=2569541 RepID=UPI0010AC0850|nr:hypothetical protein [Desulfosediminicola flagellatus]